MRKLAWQISTGAMVLLVVLVVTFQIGRSYGLATIAPPSTSPVSPLDLASVLLMAASVILTGVGIVVAIAAFFSFQLIREAAVAEAKKAAENIARQVAEPAGRRGGIESFNWAISAEDANGIARAQPPEDDRNG